MIRTFIRLCFAFLALLRACLVLAAEGSPPLVWQGTVEIAAGKGEHGPWQQNESRYDYVDDPTVAVDDCGDVAVAWVDQGRKDVFFQHVAANGAVSASPPVNVSRSPATFSWLPRLVVERASPGHVFVLWQEIIFSGGSHGGEIFFARSSDGGASFSEPINLSNSMGGDGKGRITKEIWHNGSLDLAVSNDGTLYAVWTEYDGPLWFSRSKDGGESFSAPVQIGGSRDRPARAPSLAAGSGPTVYLAWTTGEDEGADIRMTKSVDGGASFAETRIVAPTRTYSDAPSLAVDSRGILHLAYAESAGGPFSASHVRYTRSRDGGANFEPPREISVPLPRSFAGAGYPQLGIDSKGRIYVSWDLFLPRRARPTAQGMTISNDGGDNFSGPALVPGSRAPINGTNGSQQGLLMKKLAVNGAGAVAIANSSLQPETRSRVWLVRGSLPGAYRVGDTSAKPSLR